jgi:anti-sigma regulatory factor (Ser/Thr protein kinase)
MSEESFIRDVNKLGDLYRFAEDIMTSNSVDESVRFPIQLALEELFVNLVTYNPGAHQDILISVELTNQGVTVTITDYDAAEFDVTRDPNVDTSASLDKRKPGGLGLHLIQHMVDTLEYDYRDGRSRIRFSKEPESNDV